MKDPEIKIVNLPPMRVACINGFSQEPEIEAFEKLYAWAKAHNMLGKPCRIFGLDNPMKSPGSPNRGYDVWVTVDETVKADDLVSIVDFPGGLYAVFRVEVSDPYKDIGPAWQTLVKWMENSKYSHGTHQCLEEHIGPLVGVVNQVPFTLDLHIPIKR